MDTLTALNIAMSLVLACAVTAIWASPHIHEGMVTKLGLGTLSLGLLFGAFALWNDPAPYLPLMLCWAGMQIGALVAVAGVAIRLIRHKGVLRAVKVASGWTPLDDQPLADQ